MTRSDTVSWRRLTVLPLILLIASVGALNAAGWLIDASSLDQGEDSWGYAFGAFFLTLYALPVLVVAAGSALVGWLSTTPGVARTFAWVGAIVSALAAAFLALVVVASFQGVAAEAAFGLVSLVTALVLVVPAVLCGRLAARQRTSA